MYDLYKPLRNRLRGLSLLPSLLAVYQWGCHRQFNGPLAKELRYPGFDVRDPYEVGLYEWTLEILARELILNASDFSTKKISNWNDFAELANRIRDIEDKTWGMLPNGPALIQYEMVRIAHRQFPWQLRPNVRMIASYYKFYSDPRLAELISADFGMSPKEFYQLALSLCGHFMERPLLKIPVANQVNGVAAETIARFIGRFTKPLSDLRKDMLALQAYNANWHYAFDPLRTFPLIKISEDRLFCPFPTLLFWRVTDGLYFDLVKRGVEFDRVFGFAFQDLAAAVIRDANPTGELTILPEQRYGTKQKPKDSVDLIIQDGSASLFVECKASRLKSQAKVDIHDTAVIDGELDRLVRFVVQVYATMWDALNGAYPHWEPGGRPVYPMVLTLDEWLSCGHMLNDRLAPSVRAGVVAKGIPADLVDQHPYTLCSLLEFESAAKAFSKVGINTVMSAKTEGECQKWAMLPFLSGRFSKIANDGRALFTREFDELITGLVPGR